MDKKKDEKRRHGSARIESAEVATLKSPAIMLALLQGIAQGKDKLKRRGDVLARRAAELEIKPSGLVKSQVQGGGPVQCQKCGYADCLYSDMRLPNNIGRYMSATGKVELKAEMDRLIAAGIGLCADCAPRAYWSPIELLEHFERARANGGFNPFEVVETDGVVGYCQKTWGCGQDGCEIHVCGLAVRESEIVFDLNSEMLTADSWRYRQLLDQAKSRNVPCKNHRSGNEVDLAFIEALRGEYIRIVNAEFAQIAEFELGQREWSSVIWRCKTIVGQGRSASICSEQGTADQMYNPEGKPPKGLRGYMPICCCRYHGKQLRLLDTVDYKTGATRKLKVYPLAGSIQRTLGYSKERKLREDLNVGRTRLDQLPEGQRQLLEFAAYMVGLQELGEREPTIEAGKISAQVEVRIGGEEVMKYDLPSYRVVPGGEAEEERLHEEQTQGTLVNGWPIGPAVAFRERHLCGFDGLRWGCCGGNPRSSEVMGFLVINWWKKITLEDGRVVTPQDRGYIVGANALLCGGIDPREPYSGLLDQAARLIPEHAAAFQYYGSFFAANEALKELQNAQHLRRDEQERALRERTRAEELRLTQMRAELHRVIAITRTYSPQAIGSWMVPVLEKDWEGQEMPKETRQLKVLLEMGDVPGEITDELEGIEGISDRRTGDELKVYLQAHPSLVESFGWRTPAVRAIVSFLRTQRKRDRLAKRVAREKLRGAKSFGSVKHEITHAQKNKVKEDAKKAAEAQKAAKRAKKGGGSDKLDTEKGPSKLKASQGGRKGGRTRQEIQAMMATQAEIDQLNKTAVVLTSGLAAEIKAAGVSSDADGQVEATTPPVPEVAT